MLDWPSNHLILILSDVTILELRVFHFSSEGKVNLPLECQSNVGFALLSTDSCITTGTKSESRCYNFGITSFLLRLWGTINFFTSRMPMMRRSEEFILDLTSNHPPWFLCECKIVFLHCQNSFVHNYALGCFYEESFQASANIRIISYSLNMFNLYLWFILNYGWGCLYEESCQASVNIISYHKL